MGPEREDRHVEGIAERENTGGACNKGEGEAAGWNRSARP